MKKTFISSVALLLFLISGPGQPAQGQELHTYVDRDSVRVGDIISYTLVLNTGDNFQSAVFPGEDKFDDEDLIFVNRQRHRLSANRDSVVYHLQFFGTEDFIIARMPVELTNNADGDSTIYSNPVPLFFKTVIAEGDEEFRPFKPIFAFAADLWPWLLAIILLGLTAWLLYRYLKNREPKPEPKKAPEPVPFENPLLRLRDQLHTLSGENSPLKSCDFKEFYVLLGDAIREYFENVYDIDALEMTSGEIMKELREYPAEKEIITITRKVLNEADMVKFAKFEPDIPQANKALEVAFQFLEVVTETDKSRIEELRETHESQQELLTAEAS
jgi:hypothetical protein